MVTMSGGQDALPGTPQGSAKVTAFSEYPAKGRATGGVRAHRFLKGEDSLLAAWAGHGPAKASSSTGVVRALPVEHGHRDGSGVALGASIDLIGPSLSGPAAARHRSRRRRRGGIPARTAPRQHRRRIRRPFRPARRRPSSCPGD